MCTRVVEVMDLDGVLSARIDRKLLAGLRGSEEYRTVRVPSTAAKWSTWRRYASRREPRWVGPSPCSLTAS